MSGIKAFSSSLKHLNAPKAHPTAKTEQQFVTMTPTGYDKHGLDVVLKAHYPIVAIPTVIDAVQPTEDADRVLFITGHGLRQGDIVRFAVGSSLEGIESEIVQIVDANTIVLATKLPSVPVAGVDSIDLLRGVTLRTSANGTLQASSGPIEWVLDGVPQQLIEDTATPANNRFAPVTMSFDRDGVATRVVKDTVTPANTRAMPVELVSVDGVEATFNVSTGDLNVALTHDGAAAAYDSTRIGDGTNLAAVNVSGEQLVRDADALTALASLLTELQLKADLSETQPVSAASLPLPTGAATETTLAALAAEDFATQTTLVALLTELQAKADLAETQPVSAASLPLPTGAATENTLANIGVILGAIDDVLVSGANNDQLRVDVISSALPTGASTESTLQGVRTAVELIDNAIAGTEMQVDIVDAGPIATQATLASVLTSLQALDNALVSTDTDKLATESDQLPTALGSQTSANSLSVTMASDSKTEIDSDTVVAFAQLDYSTTNLSTSAYETLIGDIGATAGKKVVIFHSSGTPVYLATGAAAAETDRMIVIPGGFNHPVEIELAANARLSLKSIGSAVTSGQMIINVLG